MPTVPERSASGANARRPKRRSASEPAAAQPAGGGQVRRLPLFGQRREVAGDAGARLRARREEAGLSLRQFASGVGVSASFLSQVEKGRTQPSVATLYAICSALGLSIDELFSAEEAQTDGASRASGTPAAPAQGSAPGRDRRFPADARTGQSAPVVRRGKGAVLVLDSGVTWERLATVHEPGLDFMLVRYEPGGCSTPDGRLMRHMGTEYGFVLSGVLEVTLAFETYYLEPGDSISFDSSTPHRLSAMGDDPVEAVWFVHGRNGAHDH